MDRIEITLSPEMRAAFAEHCQQQGDTMSGFLRRQIMMALPHPDGLAVSLPLSAQEWATFGAMCNAHGMRREDQIAVWVRRQLKQVGMVPNQ